MKFANIFTLKLCLKRSLLTEAFTSHYSHAQHGLAIFALVQDKRVPNRFGGMWDLAFFRGDIRDLS